MRTNRGRLMVFVVVGVMALAVAFVCDGFWSNPIAEAKTSGGCSLGTVHGKYGGVWTGLLDLSGPPKKPQLIGKFTPYDGMEVSSWDGAGNFSASDVFAIGGTPAQPANDMGTYTVSSNCTGTLLLTNGLTFDFIILHRGNEIRFAETDGSPTVVIETRIGSEGEN
jgi:hypothetical protein